MSDTDIFQVALDRYKVAICDMELEFHSKIDEILPTKVGRYFRSTPNRRAFYYLMCRAAYVKELYTVSQISEKLQISRQSATTLVQECLAEGWIISPEPSAKRYRASKTLIELDDSFALERLERVRGHDYFDAGYRLISCLTLRQAS